MEDIFQNGNYDRLCNSNMTTAQEIMRKEVRILKDYLLYNHISRL